jgi:hypothetical protein
MDTEGGYADRSITGIRFEELARRGEYHPQHYANLNALVDGPEVAPRATRIPNATAKNTPARRDLSSIMRFSV